MASGSDIAKAYVQIIPSAEGIKGKLQSVMDGEGDGAGKSAGSKFASAFGSAAKAGAVAAAVAIGALIKNAVESYAEYEQLVGGVEKIFNEANQEQILKDANEAYKNLNMSANEYLASINKTGATFAMTMGDQKGYDTAKKGMQAIADYASGTGANLEMLNEKYGMITRSAGTYQSIADQFAGILPATSDDFLAQAQAAGFLSGEYKKLTDVPIAEYQEAVTMMLEKGVDDMGLLGNTTKESMNTISGSLAMSKSAWSNFVRGLADENANIEELTQNLVTSIKAVAQNILPVIGQVLSTILSMLGNAIADAANRLLEGGVAAISSFANGIRSRISEVAGAAWSAVTTFVSGIASRISMIVNKGREVLQAFKNGVVSAVSSLASAGLNLVKGIWSGISNGLGWIKGKIQGWVGDVTSFIKRLFGIKSPSTVMRDQVGIFLAQGIGVGFENGMVDVERTMRNSMPDFGALVRETTIPVSYVADAYGANNIGAGHASGATINYGGVNIIIEGRGKDANELARELQLELNRRIPAWA